MRRGARKERLFSYSRAPSVRKVDAFLSRPSRGLKEHDNKSLQRGRQSWFEKADESTTAAERDPDLSSTGEYCRHLLQPKRELADAGKVEPASEKVPEGWGATNSSRW